MWAQASTTASSLREVVLPAYLAHWTVPSLGMLPERVADDKLFAIGLVGRNGQNLCAVSSRMRADAQVVRAPPSRMTHDRHALKFASKQLRDTPEIVFAAMCDVPAALECASDRLRADAEFVHFLVDRFPMVTHTIQMRVQASAQVQPCPRPGSWSGIAGRPR
jgi:hypothetical protein